MIEAKAYGVLSATSNFAPLTIERREPGPDEVLIEIAFCGICHSDIHTARGEWAATLYPCVPGHEIVGRVTQVGKRVKRFRVGDVAGVGCYVDSCGKCSSCRNDDEQYCENRATYTYNTPLQKGGHTLGGYSSHITLKEKYAFKIKKGLPLERVAPLLCAGITTYSPLKRFGAKRGTKVGVVGLGGLGHMAIKLAHAMGAEVTVFSTSPEKEKDAKKLGAKKFIVSRDPQNFKKIANSLDLIIDTVSADHDLSPYVMSLKRNGTMVLLGVPPKPSSVAAGTLIGGRRRLTGSLIGGVKETQEMLDFCARKKVFSDIELIPAQKIDQAYERTVKSQVKYRFVIDAKTF